MTSTTDSPRLRTLSFIAAACAALAACSASGGHPSTGSSGTSSGAGGSNTSSSTGGFHDDCTVLCATEATACPKTMTSECVALCEGTKLAVPWCSTIVDAATMCLSMQPASSFQCDMNGQPLAKSGVCMSAIAAMQSCFYTGPPSGLPDLTQACSATCASEASLSCADPSCTTNCEASVKPGPKCNGAFAALVACAATQPASSFACTTTTPPQADLNAGVCGFQQLLLGECLAAP